MIEHRREITLGEFQMLRAREIEKARDQGIGAVDFFLNVARHLLGDRVFGGHAARQHLGPRSSWCHGIPQFVREAGGELSKRGQAFRPAHFGFGAFQVFIRSGELIRGLLRFDGFLAHGPRQPVRRIAHQQNGKKAQRKVQPRVGTDHMLFFERQRPVMPNQKTG